MIKAENKGLAGLAIGRMLYTPSNVIMNIFVALILFQNGLMLWQVCCFYGCYGLVDLLIAYPIGRLLNRYGPRVGYLCAVLGSAAQALGLLGFVTLWPTLGMMLVLAAMCAIGNHFEWVARLISISHNVTDDSKGKRIALLDNLAHVSAWSVKLLGGLLAGLGGQSTVIIVAAGMALAAVAVIWPNPQLKQGYKKLERVSLRQRATKRERWVTFCWYVHNIAGMWLWTIYISMTYPTFQGVGTIFFVASFVTVVLSQILGWLVDKKVDVKQERSWRTILLCLTVGAVLAYLLRSGVVILLRPGSRDAGLVLTMATVSCFTVISLFQTLWQMIFPRRVQEMGVNFIISMNLTMGGAQVAFWAVLIPLSYFHLEKVMFVGGFMVGAAASVGCLFTPPPTPGTPIIPVSDTIPFGTV